MKVLHVIPSVSSAHGGPSTAIRLMARALRSVEVDVEVATTDDDGVGRRASVPLGQPVHSDDGIFRYFAKQSEFYKISRPFGQWMTDHVTDYDLVHVHGLFSYTSVVGARLARRHGIPYIIRPLGVLNRWGLENRRPRLKSLSFRFLEKSLLRDAGVVHYTSDDEQRQAEMLGVTSRGRVIPLGVDIDRLELLPSPDEFHQRYPATAGRQIVLFLSRLDPKKGLDLLLPAFANLAQRQPDAALVIAGSGEPSFVDAMQDQARRLNIADRIVWAGFLEGREKLAALAAATAFVLPSYSENFGIALVEALAAGKACVMTDEVGVAADVRQADAGLVVRRDVAAIANGLESILNDVALRSVLAENARQLVNRRFSLSAMGTALRDLYETLVLNPVTALQ